LTLGQEAGITTVVGQKRKGCENKHTKKARVVFVESEDDLDENLISLVSKGVQVPDADLC
jgi:hypothetical protein